MNERVRPPSAGFIAALAAPVPRYTSYPTAPHFTPAVDARVYRDWLGRLGPGDAVSVYAHIPFCDRLCWFCGCHTRQTLRYGPIARYLEVLEAETGLVAKAIGRRQGLAALALGGGSPSMLKGDDLARLGKTLRRHFDFADNAEIAVEIDPNDMRADTLDGLRALGMTRASIGVQDFDPDVQAAINRIQSFADTARIAESLRSAGVRSLNIDALYGLPFQTLKSLESTTRQVIALGPDRIALFGYAHVPWMKPHQRLIPEAALPDAAARFDQARLAGTMLLDAGYVPIGIDHFARPGDSLAIAAAQGRLRRNFQGYTDDGCGTLIGLGASAIGRMSQGHVQNMAATGNYIAAVMRGELPVARGHALTADDRVRGHVIERLMCDFGFAAAALRDGFGPDAETVLALASEKAASSPHLVEAGGFYSIPPASRPFTRTIASWFDARLGRGTARHSTGV